MRRPCLEALTIDIPIRNEDAGYYGFWTGKQWFRGSADYRATPQTAGVVFESTKPGRETNPAIKGSFIPFVVLAGEQRAINWFAENDRGWTKTSGKPDEQAAVQILRDETTTTLRLRVIQAPTRIDRPLTITFGLHLAPIKPMPANRRSIAWKANFSFVDAFGGRSLKSDVNDLFSFKLMPDGDDWEAAADRAQMHRQMKSHQRGYPGPILYIDRNYASLPADAGEHAVQWYASGGLRYVSTTRDMHIWCMNQWLDHKLINGVYIDDIWVHPMGDPKTGPAYALDDGKVQPGFEFFDYNAYMRRLRWLFVDHGVEPLIWVHATQTFFLPIVGYADIVLDGEDRFPEQGGKSNFIGSWGLARLRFNQPDRWGLVTDWMFKSAGLRGTLMPQFRHWGYRQDRAFQAGLMLHDIAFAADTLPTGALDQGGLGDDRARVIGYWQPETPASCEAKDVLVTTYLTPRADGKSKACLIIASLGDADRTIKVSVDAAKLGMATPASASASPSAAPLKARDVDDLRPPPGEDATTTTVPSGVGAAGLDLHADKAKSSADQISAAIDSAFDEQDPVKSRAAWFNDHNFKWEAGTLELRVRAHDYRVIVIEPWRGGASTMSRRLKSAQEFRPMPPLTPEQALQKRRELVELGYCVVPGILKGDLLARLRAYTDGLFARKPVNPVYRYQGSDFHIITDRVWKKQPPGLPPTVDHDPIVDEVIDIPEAWEAFRAIGLENQRPDETIIVLSKPAHGPPLYWHQDMMNWNHPESAAPWPTRIFVSYYMTDTTLKNGCLRAIPGTHRKRIPLHADLPPAHGPVIQAVTDYANHPAFADHPDAVDLPVKAGDMVLNDARLLHAARANQTDQRRTLVLQWHNLFEFPKPPSWWTGPVPEAIRNFKPGGEYVPTRTPGEHLK
ncbi:MAG: DUF6067 family protein [Planctomycetota bacterium]|nr:DUF6067 family protein [Planctomycetota bacterium]